MNELLERNTNEATGVMWMSHDVMHRINSHLGYGTAGHAFLVYITLLTIASESGDSPIFSASQADIIAIAKMQECEVVNALKDLERLGIVEIEHGQSDGEPDVYELMIYRPHTYREPAWLEETQRDREIFEKEIA